MAKKSSKSVGGTKKSAPRKRTATSSRKTKGVRKPGQVKAAADLASAWEERAKEYQPFQGSAEVPPGEYRARVVGGRYVVSENGSSPDRVIFDYEILDGLHQGEVVSSFDRISNEVIRSSRREFTPLDLLIERIGKMGYDPKSIPFHQLPDFVQEQVAEEQPEVLIRVRHRTAVGADGNERTYQDVYVVRPLD